MRALSAAIATLFSINHARSIFTGDIIAPETYMSEFTSKPFVPIWDYDSLQTTIGEVSSSKLIPNMLLVSEDDEIELKKSSPLRALVSIRERLGNRADQVLVSQFISDDSLKHLARPDPALFLFERSDIMLTAAGSFLAKSE